MVEHASSFSWTRALQIWEPITVEALRMSPTATKGKICYIEIPAVHIKKPTSSITNIFG